MTQLKKPAFILLVFILLPMVLLAGCTGNKKQVIDVSFMYCTNNTQGSGVKIEQWLQEYSEQTGKKIKDLSAPYEGYGQKLLILLGAREAPDLFFLPLQELPIFIEKGAVLALDSFMQQEQFAYPDREKYPYLYGADGKLYALQLDEHSIYVMFIRTPHQTDSWELLKFLRQKTGQN